jgi:UDP-3-O-[3-hydroxymyristoyl] glucosamine N-acyltransferase
MEKPETKKTFTIAAVCEKLNAEIFGDPTGSVTGVNSVEGAGPTDICFVTAIKHVEKLAETRAAAVIIFDKLESVDIPQIIVPDVNAALIETLNLFAPKLTPLAGIHPRAVVEDSAILGKDVAVGPGAYISHGTRIGDGTVIGPGVSIGENSTIGSNCRLDSNVVVYHNCKIGNNCIILANTTIGGTGFGYAFIDGQHRLIPHNGGVVIEDCVDIGANCCVDRAKFGETVIGAGTKIDNLVQIGHNAIIGKCCVLAGQIGMAGSSQIGNGVAVAGQSGIREHIKVGDGAQLGARTCALSDVAPGQTVLGFPAIDAKDQIRIWMASRRLPDMVKQLRKTVARVDRIEESRKGD